MKFGKVHLRTPLILLVVVALGSTVLAGCLPPPPPPVLSVTTSVGLFPNFDVNTIDYVARCGDGTPITINVTTPDNMWVSVAYQPWRGGPSTWTVARPAGQLFTIDTVVPPAAPVTHIVRCLPTDFPQWNVQTSSQGSTPFFMTAALSFAVNAYTTIFDRNGVPLWWSSPQNTIFSTLLPDGNVGAMLNGGVEERTLDGTFVRSVDTVGGPADPHDVVVLPNGDYVMVTIQPKTGVDLTAIGGPADASICDHVVQEINPTSGSVVWSWDVNEHIPVTEMDPQWYATYITAPAASACGYDVYHWNAIEPTSTGFLLSFRHLDAVYAINQATGDIEWKLGGSARPESLTVQQDPVFSGGSHFGGQHDVRLQPDGTVTLFDDGTNLGRAPRAVRYAIDTNARTATLVESVTDPASASTSCCGSARKVGPGDWVVGWGTAANGSEEVNGTRQFAITFPGGPLVYRMIPLTSSQVNVGELVAAMDARSANAAATSEPQTSNPPAPFPP